MADNSNQEQAEYWNEQAGPKWVELQSFIDAQVGPLGLAAMERLGPINGAKILDVGCGCGATSLELARRVGAGGSVLGADLSRPMLDRAAQSAKESGTTNVAFVRADAQSETFANDFDAVFSRFGVMFFADPEAAFANLRASLKANGVVSFVCWRAITENEWMWVPTQAVLEHLPPPELPVPGAPGPFAFAEEGRAEKVLAAAGFSAIDVDRHDTELPIGEGRELDEIVPIMMQMGPAARLLRDADDQTRSRVAQSLRSALEPFGGDGGLAMKASVWLVRASA